MTPDYLRLQFSSEGDGTGELVAEVQCGNFSGVSSAWFSDQRLVDFAKELASAYPLPSESTLALRGGFWNKAGTEIEQIHVGFEFYPIGSRGQIGCRVVLNTEIRESDRPNSQSSVTVELQTTYARVEAFAKALILLANDKTNEAVLKAEG